VLGEIKKGGGDNRVCVQDGVSDPTQEDQRHGWKARRARGGGKRTSECSLALEVKD